MTPKVQTDQNGQTVQYASWSGKNKTIENKWLFVEETNGELKINLKNKMELVEFDRWSYEEQIIGKKFHLNLKENEGKVSLFEGAISEEKPIMAGVDKDGRMLMIFEKRDGTMYLMAKENLEAKEEIYELGKGITKINIFGEKVGEVAKVKSYFEQVKSVIQKKVQKIGEVKNLFSRNKVQKNSEKMREVIKQKNLMMQFVKSGI